jgi:hypothetical protein
MFMSVSYLCAYVMYIHVYFQCRDAHKTTGNMETLGTKGVVMASGKG